MRGDGTNIVIQRGSDSPVKMQNFRSKSMLLPEILDQHMKLQNRPT